VNGNIPGSIFIFNCGGGLKSIGIIEKRAVTRLNRVPKIRDSVSVDSVPVESRPEPATAPGTLPVDWDSVSRFKQPEDSLGYLLWQTAHGWMRRLNSELVAMGLTHLQMIALGSTAWLTRISGPPSQARLAKFCAMDPMLISKVVRTLEKKSAILRTPDPRDTRSRLLSVTEEGNRVILQCIPVIERAYEKFFSPVGENELQFHETLLQLFRSMKAVEGE
jgi:DNA-binding MarR family transcriptional regulator